MGQLLAGASYPLRACRVLGRTPSLWPYVAVPVAVNVVVGIAVYAALLFAGLRAIDALLAAAPAA
jgi:CysZ protein